MLGDPAPDLAEALDQLAVARGGDEHVDDDHAPVPLEAPRRRAQRRRGASERVEGALGRALAPARSSRPLASTARMSRAARRDFAVEGGSLAAPSRAGAAGGADARPPAARRLGRGRRRRRRRRRRGLRAPGPAPRRVARRRGLRRLGERLGPRGRRRPPSGIGALLDQRFLLRLRLRLGVLRLRLPAGRLRGCAARRSGARAPAELRGAVAGRGARRGRLAGLLARRLSRGRRALSPGRRAPWSARFPGARSCVTGGAGGWAGAGGRRGRRHGRLLAGELLDLGRPLVHVEGRDADQEDGRRLERQLHAERHEQGVEEPARPRRAIGLAPSPGPRTRPGRAPAGAGPRSATVARSCVELPAALGARGQVGLERPTLGGPRGRRPAARTAASRASWHVMGRTAPASP